MLAASRGWCESPALAPGFLAVLLLSSVIYYLVEVRMQRAGRGVPRRLGARFGT
jgi:peptidoglycan/LPS O-acetylase OafA/YrhL